MGKRKTSRFNWYFVILAVFCFYAGVYLSTSTSDGRSFMKLNVRLASDMMTIKGTSSHCNYKFWVEEYSAEFSILRGSISSGRHREASSLRSGQVISVEIDNADLTALRSENNEVIVYGLSTNGKSILSNEEFQLNRGHYDLRVRTLSVFIGFMFLVNGLFQIPARYNYIIIGIFTLVILSMRIAGFGIY